MIETITLQQTTAITNSHKMLKSPHHFGTGRLFIKYILPTGQIRRKKSFFASLLATGYVGPVNKITEKGWTDFRALNV